jgi:DNA-binding response OmpR family regulator
LISAAICPPIEDLILAQRRYERKFSIGFVKFEENASGCVRVLFIGKETVHMAKILLVEDDADLAEVLGFSITSKGHSVQKVHSGQEALSLLRVYKYDVIILDWMMPEVTGIDVLKDYRAQGGKTPVLMLTAKDSVDDKETGLDCGADDYLTKPFHHRELLARVRALLRRPNSTAGTVLEAGGITLDPVTCRVTKDGEEIHLRPKVYSVLEFLMRHADQVFSADAILERVWMDDSLASTDTVRTHIKLLRKSIYREGKVLVENVRNRGYRLISDAKPGVLQSDLEDDLASPPETQSIEASLGNSN